MYIFIVSFLLLLVVVLHSRGIQEEWMASDYQHERQLVGELLKKEVLCEPLIIVLLSSSVRRQHILMNRTTSCMLMCAAAAQRRRGRQTAVPSSPV